MQKNTLSSIFFTGGLLYADYCKYIMNTPQFSQNTYWHHYIRQEHPQLIETKIHEEIIETKQFRIHMDILKPELDEVCKGNVIFVHGTAVYSRFYAEFAFQLMQNGFRVFLPDLPGHGQSTGYRGHFTMKMITDTMESITNYITSNYSEKIAIMGSSLGGIAALYTAAANSDIDVAICHNAAVFNEGHHKEIAKVGPLLRLVLPFVPFLAKIFPKLQISVFKYLPQKSLVSSEYGQKLYAFLLKDPLLANKYTLTSLKAQMTESPACPPEEITIPIMFINGEYDRLFTVHFLKKLFHRLPNPNNEFHVIKGADHLIFQENTPESISLVIPFLLKHL